MAMAVAVSNGAAFCADTMLPSEERSGCVTAITAETLPVRLTGFNILVRKKDVCALKVVIAAPGFHSAPLEKMTRPSSKSIGSTIKAVANSTSTYLPVTHTISRPI